MNILKRILNGFKNIFEITYLVSFFYMDEEDNQRIGSYYYSTFTRLTVESIKELHKKLNSELDTDDLNIIAITRM